MVSLAVHEVLEYVFFNRAQLSTTVDSAMATRDNPTVRLRHVPMPRPGFSRAFSFLAPEAAVSAYGMLSPLRG